MTNRLLTLAVIGAVGAGSAATIATAHQGRGGHAGVARTQIATVTSYASGTLTLKTTGGTTVSGKVTGRTRISCLALSAGTTPAATPTPTATPDPAATTPTTPTQRGDRDRGGRGPGRGERLHRGGEDDDNVCDTSSLTAGTGVLAASTELTATGEKFTRVVLVSTTTADSDSTDS